MKERSRVLEGVKPERVFYYFEELCRIPHGSRNTKQISDYCMEFAKKHGLEARQDEWNNCIIIKKATAGREKDAGVILQGHLDMVTEKEPDCEIDMEKEGLELAIQDDYVYAKHTTLGGDDGIAIAYALAILESSNISHPALEAVFTVDEEIGMLGAKDIDIRDLQGSYVLNLDSEEEGILLSGCAGGMTVKVHKELHPAPAEGDEIEIEVCGLTGGHSGVEIHKERANANIILGRLLYEMRKQGELYLVSMEGGNKDNAIPRHAKARIIAKKEKVVACVDVCNQLIQKIKSEYSMTDCDMEITVKIGQSTSLMALPAIETEEVIKYLFTVPNGVISRSTYIPGLVETSLNLGIIRLKDEWIAVHSVRSDVQSRKWLVAQKIKALASNLKADVEIEGEYPAWSYKEDSKLRPLMIHLYEEMFAKPAKVETVHAGLECGYLLEKKPELDIVSFGPNILDIHTTQEKMSISSVERTYRYILRILEEIH